MKKDTGAETLTVPRYFRLGPSRHEIRHDGTNTDDTGHNRILSCEGITAHERRVLLKSDNAVLLCLIHWTRRQMTAMPEQTLLEGHK